MICFEICVNGKKVCLAGVGNSGNINTIINGFGDGQRLRLSVGGLDNNEHLRWTERHSLEVGDEVTVKIVEAEAADEPISREPRK